MKTSRIVCSIVVVMITAVSMLPAEQLSKIAVLDFERLYESYPEESRVFRQIDELRRTYETRMDEYAFQIDEIDLAIIDARNADDEFERERLELTRQDIVEDRRSYNEIMIRRIETARRAIAEGEGIAREILRTIEYIAIDQGYSLVVASDTSGLLWYSKEVDITDLVINRLRAITR